MVGGFEIPGGSEFVGASNDALDNTKNMGERRERQPV